MARQTKALVADVHVKTEGLAAGELVAYASIFGNKDHHGDVVVPGAFTATLEQWRVKGDAMPLLWAHGTDPASYLGTVVEASEDSKGLKVRAQLNMNTPHGPTVYQMVKDRAVNQLSFAYTVNDSENRGDHVELKSLDLHEVTLCYRGANDQTHIVAAKSSDTNKGETMGIEIKTIADRDAALTKAEELAAEVEQGGDGNEELAALVDGVKEFNERMDKALASKALIDTVRALRSEPATDTEGGAKSLGKATGRGYLALTGKSAKSAARQAATKMVANHGAKGVYVDGQVPFAVPMDSRSPIELDRVPTSLVDVLATVAHALPVWQYRQQVTRDNKAAPVGVGALKPESAYVWETRNGQLETIAHHSPALNRYEIIDTPELESWVQDEMLFGLRSEVERQILVGDGEKNEHGGNNLVGVLNTPDIAEQAYTGDLIETTRAAVTQLESIGREPGIFVVSPVLWQALELTRNDSGAFDLYRAGQAVDRAQKKLHGVRVVLAHTLPADTAVLLDLDAVQIDTDTHGLVVAEGTVDDQFVRNQKTMLVEGRFGVSVRRPTGVVKIETAAAGE